MNQEIKLYNRILLGLVTVLLIGVTLGMVVRDDMYQEYNYQLDLDQDSIHIRDDHGFKHTIHADSLCSFLECNNL